MVRHTHRRRQTKGRRRHTRRSRRTQRGGGWFDFFGSSDVNQLQQKLNTETDPEKKAEIQKELSIEQAKQQYDKTVKQLKERSSQGNTGMSSSSMDNSSMGSNTGMGMGMGNNTGMGMGNQSMFGAGRRRRSHRRK